MVGLYGEHSGIFSDTLSRYGLSLSFGELEGNSRLVSRRYLEDTDRQLSPLDYPDFSDRHTLTLF